MLPGVTAAEAAVGAAPGVVVQRRVEVVGQRDLARRGVELEVDVDLLPGGTPAASRCSAASGIQKSPPMGATVVR